MVTLSLFLLNGMIASSRYSDASNGPTVNINYTDNVTYCKKEKAHISHLEEKKRKKRWGGVVGWWRRVGVERDAKDRTT